jgi:hypothetical protein
VTEDMKRSAPRQFSRRMELRNLPTKEEGI